MMSYVPPVGSNVDFELESYTEPIDSHNIVFDFVSGATVKIKLSGTIVEKPLMIKIGGVVSQASAITVKTT